MQFRMINSFFSFLWSFLLLLVAVNIYSNEKKLTLKKVSEDDIQQEEQYWIKYRQKQEQEKRDNEKKNRERFEKELQKQAPIP